jgi:hypothetical protein
MSDYTLRDLMPANRPPRRGLPAGAIVGIVLGGIAVLIVGCLGAGYIAVRTAQNTPRTAPPAAAPATTRDQPADQPATRPQVVSVPLGQELVMSSRGLGSSDVTHYTLTADKQYAKTPKYGNKPEKGTYYAVRAAVEVTAGSNYVSPLDFALVAADGTVFEASSGFGFDGAMEGVELQAGQKTGGLVVFDVPPAALSGARIQLRSGGYSPDSDQAYWEV